MADLAACYFCGDAPEGALVERPVVPDAVRPSDDVGPTVALCPDCAEKLSRVTSAIVDAADSAPEARRDRSQQESAAEASQPPEPDPPATDDTADDAPADTGADQATASPDEDTAATEQSATDDETDEGQRSVVEGDHSISALEYNKVMRLLQNREFPIDREEIVTVAASAYQVSRYDCDRVIDIAIDRGLIEEADGQLLKPE